MNNSMEAEALLTNLPSDVLDNILQLLDASSLSKLACTCRALASRANDDKLWHVHCTRRWRHWSALQIARSWQNKFSNRWMVGTMQFV